MFIKALLFGLLVIGVSYYFGFIFLSLNEGNIPVMLDDNWGSDDNVPNTSIIPFVIDVPKSVITDLNDRLSKTRELVPPFQNTGWTYGISSIYLKYVVNYWKTKYDWNKRQNLLNKYPQYTTKIQGLTIHYYHIKPNEVEIKGKGLKVLPLLLVHGWPGSIVEFQKIIPMLISPRNDKNFVFELVIPSLPGYGFSQGAVRPGLGHPQIAVILKNLMMRLGYNKFYTQGGDWGSIITTDMASLFPERIYGTHLNMCSMMGMKVLFWQIVGSFIPSLVIEPKHHSKMYPLKNIWSRIMEESGYFHLHATKPDTIGAALSDSPVALAAYILEKYSTWTNPEYRFREDGGLLEKFNLDELLDNIMIYWISNSTTTSVRLYAESFSNEIFQKYQGLSTHVPTGCAVFPHELMYLPESILKMKYKKLIQFNYMPRGGHFAAFEEPQLLANDIWQFVTLTEANATTLNKK